MLVLLSSSAVKQKVLVIKSGSSTLGCLGMFHHPEHTFFALASLPPPRGRRDFSYFSSSEHSPNALKRQVLEFSLPPVYPSGCTFECASEEDPRVGGTLVGCQSFLCNLLSFPTVIKEM